MSAPSMMLGSPSVVIVGGGPAGLSTALFLVAAEPSLASRIVVLERARYPRDKICAGAIGARADRALRAIGVRVEVPSVEVFGLAARSRQGSLLVRSERAIGRVVRRIEFDAELARIAKERGISVLEGAEASAITRAGDGFELSLGGGELLRTRTLVGADGVESRVRKALGFGRGKTVAQVVEVDTELRDGEGDTDVLHFDLSRRGLAGYGWDFPTPLGGNVRMSRGIYDVGRRGVDVAELARSHVEGARLLGGFRRYAEQGLSTSSVLSQRGVLLVGEAAGIDPVLGEGIAQAILHGEVAGKYLASALGHGDQMFADYEQVFAQSRAGRDLRRRVRALGFTYGRGRSLIDHVSVESEALVRLGMALFAGEPISKRTLWRSGGDLAVSSGKLLFDRLRARATRW